MSEERAQVAVQAEGLVKHYGDVEAVRGVDLRVERGEVFGFLGPNGAGKSTTVRMLTTLLSITSGTRARGRRGRRAASPTRRGTRSASRCRRPGSTRARPAASCSCCRAGCSGCPRGGAAPGGGAARAGRARGRRRPPHQGLLRRHEAPARPRLRARARARGAVPRRADHGPGPREPADRVGRGAAHQPRGTTVFLTTQYLEEADQLCDRLAIIDGGLIVREGTPAQLKDGAARAPRARRATRRSTTCSSTRPAARAAASPATCRR